MTEVTVFVYSAGKLAAEYSTAPPEQNPTTKWTVTDQLGSPRVLVDSLGQVVSRRDFMPFGEEIFPDGVHRTTSLKYTYADNVRQKFTGYQKDEETGLDFAEARMYENRHARFTAVDPLLASGKNANPQTFNRYVYVLNNPLIFTDPTGLQTNSVVRGRVFYNPAEDTYQIGKCDGCVRVTGPPIESDRSDGNRYRIASNYWRILGRTADFVNESTRANISGGIPSGLDAAARPLGPDPVIDPKGYELNKVREGVEALASQIADAAYTISPDYCRAGVSLPGIRPIEAVGSKDARLYLGGAITNISGVARNLANRDQEGGSTVPRVQGFSFRMSASFGCGYFLTTRMTPPERHYALSAPSFGISAGTPMFHGGVSQPLTDGAPAAVEMGIGPNTGVSVTTTTEVRPNRMSFGDWMRGRRPWEENR